MLPATAGLAHPCPAAWVLLELPGCPLLLCQQVQVKERLL